MDMDDECTMVVLKNIYHSIRWERQKIEFGYSVGEILLPTPGSLFSTVEGLIESPHVVSMGGMLKILHMLDVNKFVNLAIQEGGFHGGLPDCPSGSRSECPQDPEGVDGSSRGVSICKVNTLDLMVAKSNPLCLETYNPVMFVTLAC